MAFKFRHNEVEDQIQAEIFDLIKVGCDRKHVLAFSVPNGGKRDKRTAEKMKLTGQRAGIPDIMLIRIPDGRAYFVEVKRPGGKLSKEQREFRDYCAAARLPWALVHSRDEMQAVLGVWDMLKPEFGAGPAAGTMEKAA